MKWQDFSKAELICWIENSVMRQPRVSDLLYIRWFKGTERLQQEQDDLDKDYQAIDFKTYNAIIREFNACKDAVELMNIATRLKPYEKKYDAYLKGLKEVRKKSARLEQVYKQIDIERKNE